MEKQELEAKIASIKEQMEDLDKTIACLHQYSSGRNSRVNICLRDKAQKRSYLKRYEKELENLLSSTIPSESSEIINLTPHMLNIVTENGVISIKSSGIARAEQTNKVIGYLNGLPLCHTEYGAISGLPAPKENTVYFVSLIIRNLCPNRRDLISPSETKRDEKGNIIGVTSFSIN